MINTTHELIFICKDEDIKPLIIKAVKLTHRIILEYEGVKSITLEQAINENSREKLHFSFFQYFSDIDSNTELSKNWLSSLFNLVVNRTQNEYLENIPNFFTYESRQLPKQKAKLLKCRQHLHLFFHNLWCLRIALLPTSYSQLPVEKYKDLTKTTRSGRSAYCNEAIGEDYYPEFLKLARSPLLKKPYNQELNDHIPNSSLKNIDWYVHRIVRAQDVWELKELTEAHLKDYSDLEGISDLGFRKCNLWLSAIVDIHEELLGFNSSCLESKRSAFSDGNPSNWLTSEESNSNIHHKEWETLFSDYAQERVNAGYTSAAKIPSQLRFLLLAPLLAKKIPFPSPADYNRDHLNITKDSLRNNKHSVLGSYMRIANGFFEWLEISINNFKNPILIKIDIPKGRRPQATTKKLLPEESYPVVISYNYGICEFIEYVNFHMDSEKRNKLVNSMNSKIIIYTQEWGFVPFYICKSVIKPIVEIPSILLSPIRSSEHIKKRGVLKDSVLLPHTSNLTAVQMETGIRRRHLQWLDNTTFDCVSLPLNKRYPRGYGINKIHVNTDKSHGPWDATVSDSVLSVLKSQLKFRQHFLRGEDKATWYNKVTNSPFGKITPLFATVSPNLASTQSFSVTSETSLAKYWKVLIKTVSFEMLKCEDTYKLSAVEGPTELNILEFANSRQIKIDQTPHSCRSQVISDKITILPPSIIKEMTGHCDDAHLVYYAQIKTTFIDAHERSSSEQLITEIEAAISNTQNNESPLKTALRGDNLGEVLANYGAFSFEEVSKDNTLKSGLHKLRELNSSNPFQQHGLSSELFFDTTHICPFNNQCPNDVKSRLKGRRACGSCPYSIKTIDHLPAITMKLRRYTDEIRRLKYIIDEAKRRKESMSNLKDEFDDKRFYADEIAAWSASHSYLSKMAGELSQKDKWLVEKPEVIREKLSQCKASNELTLTLLKISDAEQSAKYMTPMLTAKVSKLRKQLLISTKEYEKLLIEPEGYELLNEFKGIISSICAISGISPIQLGDTLSQLHSATELGLEVR